MSYHTKSKLARYRSHGQPVPIGGIFDAIFGSVGANAAMQNVMCPPSSAYNEMLARIGDLESTWHPTGYYSWNEMADVIDATVRLAGVASQAGIDFFKGDSTPGAKDAVKEATAKYSAVSRQVQDYLAAWKAAKVANKPVEAPGFKRWVLDDLRAAAELFRVVEVQACMTPWWVGTAASYGRFFNGVIDVAKRVGNVALRVGENALKAVERSGDIIGFLLRWGPYLALGVGGYYAYTKFVKK